MLHAARYLHLSAISQAISTGACDTSFAAMDEVRRAGGKICYDTNLRLPLWPLPRARAIIWASAAYADYFLPSLEDAQTLTGVSDPEAVVDACLAAGARTVLLKMGATGVLVADGDRRERVPGFVVNAVDATGAGDCFAGSLLARLLAGDALIAAVRYANAAAALSTTGYGAVAPIPRPEAVRALLAGSEAASRRS
jgi:2-dehydro-3-deoxygluconokinase